MKRKITVLTLCAMLFALCDSVDAQQTTKIPIIGILEEPVPLQLGSMHFGENSVNSAMSKARI